jgi:hypothetical protein
VIGKPDKRSRRAILAELSAGRGVCIDELDSLPAAADWGEWLDRLGALATRALRQPDRVLAVLAELAPMAPVGPVTLTEILIVLEGLLLETAVLPPSQRYGKVFVGPIEAARGLSFDAVLVPGLAEKMFPRKIVEEPILLDAQLAMLMPLPRVTYCADLFQACYLFSLIALYASIVSVIALSTGNRSILEAP